MSCFVRAKGGTPARAGRCKRPLLLAACVVWLLGPAQNASAQSPADGIPESDAANEVGLPFVRHYTPREYGEAGQNWTLAQDADGLMYAGNNHGVLQYDGVRWRLIRVDNRSAVRSLAVADDGRIYVGAQREFGYLEPDSLGRLQYHSLIDHVPDQARGFLDVWEIIIRDDGVYFSTFERLLRWDGDSFDWWEPETSFHRTFNVDGRIFIRDRGAGLVEVGDDGPQPVPGGERFVDLRVDVMLPWPGPASGSVPESTGEVLVGTRDEGFMIFDGESWRSWETEVDDAMASNRLYSGTWMPDGRLALGTTQAGVYMVGSDGEFLGRLDRAAGMEDEIVYFLFVDHQNGLWMALDGGIARAGGNVALTRFDSRRGLPGRVNTLHRHDGRLYAGTNHDLFLLGTESLPRFRRVEGMQTQTWDLVSVGDELLVANNDGVYRVDLDQSEPIRPSVRTSFSLHGSEYFPGRIYVGLSNGLAVLERTDEGWRDHGRVAGVREQIRTMYESPDGELWLGSAHSGVVRLVMPRDLASAASGDEVTPEAMTKYGVADGLPELDRNYVYVVDGEPVFGTREGFMQFDEASQGFELDRRFDQLFPDKPRRLTAVTEGPDGQIWMHARDDETGRQETGAAVPQEDGRYRWESGLLHKLQGIYTYSIRADEDGILWFGGDEGLFRFNPHQAREADWPFTALIRRVEVEGGRLLHGGMGRADVPTLDFPENNVRFEFAAPSYIPREQVEYQVKLEGRDRDWLHWRGEATERRGNLWEGDYRMHVRARDARGQLSEQAVFEFEVLPPWYRTAWAYLAYLVAFLVLGALAVNLYHRRLAAQNRRLQLQVSERTEDLERAKNRAELALERLQATQAELVEAEKMATVGRLVAGMAHEINTPVSNGRMAASRLVADQEEITRQIGSDRGISRGTLDRFLDECRQGLELIESGFERIGTLVGRLHRIAGAPEGGGIESFRVAELIDDVVAFRSEELREKGVNVRTECPPSIDVVSNRLVMSECLNELISNSLVHGFPETGEAGGEIVIAVDESPDGVVIDYRDNGRGMDAELAGRIFEPFAGGMQSDSRHPGLGMHMLYQMVKRALGGEIEIRPDADGVHFVLIVPSQAEFPVER